MRTLIFATNNAHKLAEARAVAAGRLRILSLADVGLADADIAETAATLRGNALLKAQWVAERCPGRDCFADDTGLMVDALGGEPGVMSARYAGPGHDSAANMAKLLERLDGAADRRAAFVTEVALIEAGSPEPRFFTGRVDGEILEEADGCGGFGYDPVFRPAGSQLTFAAMTDDAKNAVSHRGRAIRALIDALSQPENFTQQ